MLQERPRQLRQALSCVGAAMRNHSASETPSLAGSHACKRSLIHLHRLCFETKQKFLCANIRNRPADERLPMPPVLRSDSGPLIQDGGLLSCEAAVLDCFPDICPEFLRSQAPDHGWDAQRIITHLLDEQEKGQSYPKRSNPLKRKRPEEADEKEEDEEEEIRKKFEKGDPRLASKGRAYVKTYTKAA